MVRQFKMKLQRGQALWGIMFIALSQVFVTDSSIWWNLGVQNFDSWRSPHLYLIGAQPQCTRLPGLSHGQKRLCASYYDHMPAVSMGAKLGIQECQFQFKNRRWNCSIIDDQEGSVFGAGVMRIGSREAAFVHAISSAGVVYSVSRGCQQGMMSTCGCSKRRRPKTLNRDWIWGGCGDNLYYGYSFAQGFVDLREKEKNHPRRSKDLARTLMNLHNNEAGRRSVSKNEDVKCKCHGVSGACSMKTCWQSLPSFRKVGGILQDKYNGASKVRFNNIGTRLIRDNKRLNKPTRADLVHFEDSPDYCHPDPSLGSLGTNGRRCDRDSEDTNGCTLLCCGRGYNTYTEAYHERCHCQFVWCCKVKCRTCSKVRTVHVCKGYNGYRPKYYKYRK